MMTKGLQIGCVVGWNRTPAIFPRLYSIEDFASMVGFYPIKYGLAISFLIPLGCSRKWPGWSETGRQNALFGTVVVIPTRRITVPGAGLEVPDPAATAPVATPPQPARARHGGSAVSTGTGRLPNAAEPSAYMWPISRLISTLITIWRN